MNGKLGEGAYGCVLKGRMPLSGNKKNIILYIKNKDFYSYENGLLFSKYEIISKLFIKKRDFYNEIKNTRIANKIDNTNSSIKINGYSILNMKDVKKIIDNIDSKDSNLFKKLTLCENILNNLYKLKHIYQIFYESEGIKLNDLYSKNPNINFKKMVQLFHNLYIGLYLYSLNNFYHLDIKDNNIIYLSDKDKFVFIDFGISQKNKKNYKPKILKHLHKTVVKYMLPEIIAYRVIKKYSNDIDNQNKLFKLFKKKYEKSIDKNKKYIIKYVYDNNIKKYKLELITLFNQILQFFKDKNEHNKNEYFKDIFKYIDVYKLSLCLCNIFKIYNYKINEGIYNEFMKNILSALHINVSKRATISEIKDKYNLFCKKYNIAVPQKQNIKKKCFNSLMMLDPSNQTK